MNIVLIGTVEFSRRMLTVLVQRGAAVTGVVTKASAGSNSDYADLAPTAAAAGIPLLHTRDINAAETLDWIRARRPDVVFCLGWSQLIKAPLLSAAPMGVVGYHPALLPQNRGRHPIIWALALGLEETGSTFFRMDEGADSGDILSQERVRITYEDDAASLYERICRTAELQLAQLVATLSSGTAVMKPQDNARANCWRKRDRSDGLIDFRMGSRAIYNLVRALSRPYPGASVIFREEEVKIWRVREAERAAANIEWGQVLEVNGRELRVACDRGSVWLVEHELTALPSPGEYLR